MVRIVAKLLVLFLLAYAGVSLWYAKLEKAMLQEPEIASQAAAPAQPVEKTEIRRQPNDYSIIVSRNIFQAEIVVKEDKQPEVVVQKPIEPTKLKLTLMGTISGTERDARAIISDDTRRKQDIYQVGDSIQGAIIKSIDRGKVVLNVNNRDEILTLTDREGGGPAYQPSPADFYQEPPKEEVVEQEGPQEEPFQEEAEVVEPTQVPERPAVIRPRPVRRSMSLRQRSSRSAPPDEDGR